MVLLKCAGWLSVLQGLSHVECYLIWRANVREHAFVFLIVHEVALKRRRNTGQKMQYVLSFTWLYLFKT